MIHNYLASYSCANGTGGFMITMIVFIAIGAIVAFAISHKQSEHLDKIINEQIEFSPEYFLQYRKYKKLPQFPGVYILYNNTLNKYYVGQGKDVFNRVYQHFSGKGNGDVYADWKYNNSFSIRIVPLEGSGYYNLNDLERDTIRKYNAFSMGYNKTRGNY